MLYLFYLNVINLYYNYHFRDDDLRDFYRVYVVDL